jgi:hypothetical protein
MDNSKPEKHFTEKEIKERNLEFEKKHVKLVELLKSTFEIYDSKLCQCAYPRFRQIVQIDCAESGNSFKCWETEILIALCKKNFNITPSELKDEIINEKWECKKCNSIYEFGWSDFSIAVEREKLKLVELKTESIGKEIFKPIPLYIGLFGHSYPPKTEMYNAEFSEFKNYILEK